MNTPKSNLPPSDLENLLNDFPPEVTDSEITMAKELMKQAQFSHPDAKFVNDLGRKLKILHPGSTGARSYKRLAWMAASGVVAILIFFLVGLPLLQPTLPQFAAITPTQIQAGTTAIQPSIQPTSLPPLPFLGPSSVQAGASLSEQFPNASWTLQAELPASPASAGVYQLKNPPEITVNSVRSLANQFGIAGNIYQRSSGQSDFHSYLVIDGDSQLSVYGHNSSFSYLPDFLRSENEHNQPLSFEQISERATTYLKEKGFLNFSYHVSPGILRQNQVIIDRQLDENYPMLSSDPNSPEFLVSVGADGNILEVRGQIPVIEPKGTYPLRSASDAWQALLNGKIGGRFGYQVSQLYPPIADMNWSKQRITGQQVDLYGVPETLQAADGSQPVVMMDNLVLEGSLPAFPVENQPIYHITGTLTSETHVQVEKIETASIPPENLGFIGLIQSDGTHFTLQTVDGRNLVLADAPAGLPPGEPASISGHLLADGRLEWSNILAGPSLCASFSSIFEYSDAGKFGGGGGGGGGGYDGPGDSGDIDICAKYPNMNGRITTGGFDNLKPGSAIPEPEKPRMPYQAGERVEGIRGELNGNNLLKPDGTSVPVFTLVIPETAEKPGWSPVLRGDKLTGLESLLRLQIRVWGTIQLENENPVIVVDHWEMVENIGKIEVWQGTLEIGDVGSRKGFVLSALDGKKYVLQNSLDTPPDVLQVPPASLTGVITIEGVLLPETIDGVSVIRETIIDNSRAIGDTAPVSNQMQNIMPATRMPDLISGQVNITRARLVYLSMQFAGGLLPPDHPARTLQPLWEFSGTLEDGRNINLFVQAVKDEYLK